MKIVSVGEVLWDIYGKSMYIGGAPFNFSVQMTNLGHSVYFISAVGEDERGNSILQRINDYNLTTKFIYIVKDFPTGYVNITTDKNGHPNFFIHHPVAYDFPSLNPEQIETIISFKPDWLYFGTAQQISNVARRLTEMLSNSLPSARRFYDMNLRRGYYTKELVENLLKNSSTLKLNKHEVHVTCELFDRKPMKFEDFCNWVVDEFYLEGVCITMGSRGCATFFNGHYLEKPGYHVDVVDVVGAGDAFAAGFLHGLNEQWNLGEVCEFANFLGSIATTNKGAIPDN